MVDVHMSHSRLWNRLEAAKLSRMKRWITLLALVATAACAREPAPAPVASVSLPDAATRPADHAPVQVQMQHVRLNVADGIVLTVDHLRGEMVSRTSAPPAFDDPHSYILRIATAETSMDMPSLANLMNQYVFAYAGAPLSGISVHTTPDGRIEETGTMHKGVPLHFSMKASVSATQDGRLRLHVDSVSVLGLPSKGLMDVFGLKMDDVVSLKNRRGLEIDGNDIVIAIGEVLPPPEVQGRLSRVVVEGDRLIQTFAVEPGHAAPAPLTPSDSHAANYLYFSGSDLRFGKLTMAGADLQLIDADPKDPFDFFPTKYMTQLVAGYSKTTATGGLQAFLPDYDDLMAQRNSGNVNRPGVSTVR